MDTENTKRAINASLRSILRELKTRIVENDELSAKRRENLRNWMASFCIHTDPESAALLKECLDLLDGDKEVKS